LKKNGDRRTKLLYKNYPHITYRGSINNFRGFNDAFFAPLLYMFYPAIEKESLSDEAWNVVKKYGYFFLQFPIFTYLKFGCFRGYLYVLPRYPSDKWILMDLCSKLIVVHKE
jgi:hypothetical protein